MKPCENIYRKGENSSSTFSSFSTMFCAYQKSKFILSAVKVYQTEIHFVPSLKLNEDQAAQIRAVFKPTSFYSKHYICVFNISELVCLKVAI